MLPFPPLNLRKTVGPLEDEFYDNRTGNPVFGDEVPLENYSSVFDFGCGCGRIARQLMMQRGTAVERYVGVDLYSESIRWCSENLGRLNAAYRFHHLDVFNAQFNPGSKNTVLPFPENGKFLLVNAHSVFTHITEPFLNYYLGECARVLDATGICRATWFLFDKRNFPMMQESQNCLYINLNDPTNATIYDYRFVEKQYDEHGMVIFRIIPPAVRGHQWILLAAPKGNVARTRCEFPDDVAPMGIVRPPVSM